MITGTEILDNENLWWRLEGAFFHRLNDNGIVNQGRIAEVENNWLNGTLFSYMDGSESDKECITRLELERYHFYGSHHEFLMADKKEKENKRTKASETT